MLAEIGFRLFRVPLKVVAHPLILPFEGEILHRLDDRGRLPRNSACFLLQNRAPRFSASARARRFGVKAFCVSTTTKSIPALRISPPNRFTSSSINRGALRRGLHFTASKRNVCLSVRKQQKKHFAGFWPNSFRQLQRATASPAESGVPPPTPTESSTRRARRILLEGGSSSSADVPRNPTIATLSRLM